jgi:predicted RNA-binding Zn-ribbon protein involved in translation (DUF1610 family)
VKSSHLFLRFRASPARVVTDYAPEDIAAFRERFRPIAERYRRRSGVALVGVPAFFLCLALSVALPKHLSMYFWVAGFCSYFFFIFATPRTPDCPACHTKLDSGYGVFCPYCGRRSLQPAGLFLRPPRCKECGRTVMPQTLYTIRACTHCGVMLDEKGLLT